MNKLERRIENRRYERNRLVLKDKGYEEHIKVIKEAKNIYKTDFWCDECQKDFSVEGVKQVRSAARWSVAFYEGICPKGHKCIRYITDKGDDPYYWKSKLMQIQRADRSDDMLTPDDPRFKLIYPDKYKEMYGG